MQRHLRSQHAQYQQHTASYLQIARDRNLDRAIAILVCRRVCLPIPPPPGVCAKAGSTHRVVDLDGSGGGPDREDGDPAEKDRRHLRQDGVEESRALSSCRVELARLKRVQSLPREALDGSQQRANRLGEGVGSGCRSDELPR
jgi:hypothetical protein